MGIIINTETQWEILDTKCPTMGIIVTTETQWEILDTKSIIKTPNKLCTL